MSDTQLPIETVTLPESQPQTVPLAAQAPTAAASRILIKVASTHVTFATATTTVTIPKKGFWATAWSDVKAIFSKLFHSGATWAQLASSTLTLMSPAIVLLVGLYGGPAASSAASSILSAAQTDMATLAATLQDANAANGATVTTVLNSLQTNLQSLLEALKVEDPASVSEATQLVNMLITDIEAMAKEIPESLSGTTTTAAPAAA